MKRLIFTIVAAAWPPFGLWVGGIDLAAAWWFVLSWLVLSALSAAAIYFAPDWEEHK